MNKSKIITVLLTVAAVLAGLILGATVFDLKYVHDQKAKINHEVTIETGTPIDLNDFIIEPVPEIMFYTDITAIDTDVPGSYKLILDFSGVHENVILNVVDTTAPVGEAVPQTIYCDQLPEASSVVTDVYDLAPVTIAYKTEPDVSVGGEFTFQVSLTDPSGNETVVDVPFTVVDDHTAPLIYGAHDLEGFVGESISYLDGITVTDNYDTDPVLTVDNSQVNNHISSSFPVTYIATDENGNSSSVTVNISFRVRPERYYEPEELYELCDQMIEQYSIYDEDMTDVQKAFRIFNWVHNYIHYIGTSDKIDWTVGAYDGLTTFQGDCFTYYAVCRAFLDNAGIPNMLVERYPITWSPHYWNLVKLNGVWYHCDSCYAYYHEGYYFMYAYNDLNHSDHGYDTELYAEYNVAQDSVQQYVNYSTLEVGDF
ncbi:MAG: hypothetical protein IJ757_08450 [Clostridiales bacterium]|nr:hypothetical protein [Clostridiales bacterium]